jgi:DNA repair protein RecO (recombination protein O)
MGLVETEAIVLRTYNLAEADKIVVCLTRATGIVRAVAKGARRLKSRFGAGLEPFTIIDLTYFEKEGRELVSLRQAEIIRSYFNLSNDAETVAALAYMGELLVEFAPPHEPNEKLFRMVRAVTEALEQIPSEIPALVRYFEIWTLKLAGFFPEIQTCGSCGKKLSDEQFSYLNAELKLRCGNCSNHLGTALSAAARIQLRSAQRLSPQEFAKAASNLAVNPRNEMTNLTQGLIGRALERQPRTRPSFN